MRLRICLGVKHTLTNEGKCKGWSAMIIKCTLTLGITFAWKLQMCRALVGKVNKHQIGPHDTIRKVLQRKCFKCHRIVHLDLLCISYDQKKGRESNWKFDSRRHSLESKGQWGPLGACYTPLERYFQGL